MTDDTTNLLKLISLLITSISVLRLFLAMSSSPANQTER